IDQQRTSVPEKQIRERRFPMNANVLAKNVGVFVVLNYLNTRVSIQGRDVGSIKPTKRKVAGRGSVAGVVVEDFRGALEWNARVRILRRRRIQRGVGIPIGILLRCG